MSHRRRVHWYFCRLFSRSIPLLLLFSVFCAVQPSFLLIPILRVHIWVGLLHAHSRQNNWISSLPLIKCAFHQLGCVSSKLKALYIVYTMQTQIQHALLFSIYYFESFNIMHFTVLAHWKCAFFHRYISTNRMDTIVVARCRHHCCCCCPLSIHWIRSSLAMRPLSNLIPLSRIKFLCFHCEYHILSVYICSIVYPHWSRHQCVCLYFSLSFLCLSNISLSLSLLWMCLVNCFISESLSYFISILQFSHFILIFNAKHWQAFYTGQQKKRRQPRTMERVCMCLSVYNMMQLNPFILCMRHLTVFDICKSNATNDITHSDRSQGDLLAFAVCII